MFGQTQAIPAAASTPPPGSLTSSRITSGRSSLCDLKSVSRRRAVPYNLNAIRVRQHSDHTFAKHRMVVDDGDADRIRHLSLHCWYMRNDARSYGYFGIDWSPQLINRALH
jgi:hypothetical protein